MTQAPMYDISLNLCLLSLKTKILVHKEHKWYISGTQGVRKNYAINCIIIVVYGMCMMVYEYNAMPLKVINIIPIW